MSTEADIELPTGPYYTAASTYYRAGWFPFPLRGKSIDVPPGITGREGQAFDYHQVCDWMLERPDDNLALRLVDVIGIDIDAYTKAGVLKRGDETLASAEALWGELVPTWRSTSRDPATPSGIRFYRVPEGVEFVGQLALPNEDGEVTGDIEVIQRHHRYAVVWPSTNPDTGTPYRWYMPDGTVSLRPPDVLELPALPQRWLEKLVVTRTRAEARPEAPAAPQLAVPAQWHPKVTEHYQEGTSAASGAAGSRHDATLHAVGRLARDESRGRAGATTALGMLRERFIDAIGRDAAQRDPSSEFDRMVRDSRGMVATTVSTAEAERDAVLAVFSGIPGPDHPPAPAGIEPAPIDLTDPDPWATFGSWAPAHVATYLDPNWEPEPPTVLVRTDGRALFYAANVNWLFGASGEGKTWVALIATAQALLAGEHVLWVHYEDPLPDKLIHRLRLLGVDPAVIEAQFHVIVTSEGMERSGMPYLRAVTAHYGCTLAVIDSVGEALGADGIDPQKDDSRFVSWLHGTLRVFAADGLTVLPIDHLPMADPDRLDPVHSFRKKAATTGSMFRCNSPSPPTQDRPGVILLTCAKDRSGVWEKRTTCAVVHLGPSGDGLAWTVEAPAERAQERQGEPQQILVARHAWRAVEKAKERPMSQRNLIASMTGLKAAVTTKREGIDFAVYRGWLVESQGPNRSRMFDLGPNDPDTPTDLLERWEGQS